MKYNKKVTITTILFSLILTATPSIAQADVKSTAEQPKVMDLWFEVASPLKTLTPQALPNQHIYTINSKYNAELGCTTPISLGDEKTPINRYEDAYLCNANIESEFISQEPDLSKFHEVMLAQRDKISNSRIVIMSQEKILFHLTSLEEIELYDNQLNKIEGLENLINFFLKFPLFFLSFP